MRFHFFLLFLFPLVFIFTKCQKAPDFPAIPSIAFVSINTTKISANAKDSLKITFSFTDGDGDLGDPNSQTTDTSIYITDVRPNNPEFTYSDNIPYITPKGSYKQISGNVTVYMKNTSFDEVQCRPDHAIADTVHYKIRIKDRAGHYSNTIITPTVYLNCQ